MIEIVNPNRYSIKISTEDYLILDKASQILTDLSAKMAERKCSFITCDSFRIDDTALSTALDVLDVVRVADGIC